MHTGGFLESEASGLCLQIARGVRDIHSQGIAHLDLKLSNILIGTQLGLKIVDFGSAHRQDEVLGSPEGTLHSMAPEISLLEEGEQRKDPQDLRSADMWSLAVIMFSVVAGFPPFKTPSFSDSTFRAIMDRDWDRCVDLWNKHLHKSNRCSLSPSFVDLLQKLFTGVEERLSIHEVLEHQWFVAARSEHQQFSANVLKQRLITMRNHANS